MGMWILVGMEMGDYSLHKGIGDGNSPFFGMAIIPKHNLTRFDSIPIRSEFDGENSVWSGFELGSGKTLLM